MSRVYNFSAGPSVLPLSVLETAAKEMTEYGTSGQSVMEMSHRSKEYQAIFDETVALLRELMGIPDDYEVLMLQGGASSQFAMIPLNLMTGSGKADFVLTGQWATKAYKEAARYGEANVVASSKDKTFSYIPKLDSSTFTKDADYFHICMNNTIYGTVYHDLPDTGSVPLVADASVFSFTSLARRVLRETGERTVFLSRQGRRMVIRKTAEEEVKRLTAFGGVSARAGFAERCDSFITECKRFNIAPEQLADAAERLGTNAPFAAKLSDLALLYARTEEYLAGRNMDAADAFSALCERLPRSSIAGQAVIIDGFDLISEQLYDVVGALMGCAGSLTIALRADLSPDCRDRVVFQAESRLLTRLKSIAQEQGCPTRTVRLPVAGPHEDAAKRAHPALRHLEHEAFAYPFRPYEGKDAAEAVSLFAATSRTAEAEAVADAILKAADSGIRYRDMAVIATDLDAYINPVSRALRARDIPFFTDAKHPLAGYAAARLVVSALSAAARAFRQRDVLEVAKTGLAGVETEDAEAFELYVLRYGMRGTLLTAPFARGEVPPGAERARKGLMPPLVELRTRLAGAATARAKTEALYAYLLALDVRGQLASEAESLRARGRFELMEECAQVYNMLMELFTQLHAILGEAPLSTERYIAVLQEGLSTYEVGVIPTTADQVLFGSLGRTRARSVSALFVLGAVEGVFPAYARNDGMIDDAERASLSALGLPALPSSRESTEKELADV